MPAIPRRESWRDFSLPQPSSLKRWASDGVSIDLRIQRQLPEAQQERDHRSKNEWRRILVNCETIDEDFDWHSSLTILGWGSDGWNNFVGCGCQVAKRNWIKIEERRELYKIWPLAVNKLVLVRGRVPLKARRHVLHSGSIAQMNNLKL